MARSNDEIMNDIANTYSSLSPENLCWDGERDREDAERAYVELNQQLQNLFKELGREVDEFEAYGISL